MGDGYESMGRGGKASGKSKMGGCGTRGWTNDIISQSTHSSAPFSLLQPISHALSSGVALAKFSGICPTMHGQQHLTVSSLQRSALPGPGPRPSAHISAVPLPTKTKKAKQPTSQSITRRSTRLSLLITNCFE